MVEKHEKRVGEIEAEYTLDYKNIEKRNLKPEPLKKEIKNLKDWKKKSINKEKLIFARAVRQMDSEILNEMECLLFNVNYDLIDYDQIYYLIQEPFLFYIDTFCLDILFSVINGKDRGSIIFSNIQKFYSKIIEKHDNNKKLNKTEIEEDRKRAMKNLENTSKKI